MKDFNFKGHGAMLTANAIWGLMSPLAKIVMAGGIVTPLVLTDLRIFGAMVLFWVVSFFQKPEHVHHKDMAKLLAASLLAIVFNQGCFIFGVGLTSPADASIITTSMPLWAMVLAAVFLKEPITGKKVLGIALGAGGALLLIMGSQGNNAPAASGGNPIWGDILVLGAQLSYALYIVLFKNFVQKYSLVTIMKWMFTYAFIFALPFSYSDLVATDWAALEWPAKEPAAHRGGHVQLRATRRGLHRQHLPGAGFVQSDEGRGRGADIRRCLPGDHQQEPAGTGKPSGREPAPMMLTLLSLSGRNPIPDISAFVPRYLRPCPQISPPAPTDISVRGLLRPGSFRQQRFLQRKAFIPIYQ